MKAAYRVIVRNTTLGRTVELGPYRRHTAMKVAYRARRNPRHPSVGVAADPGDVQITLEGTPA
jgi:hypothetical protein